MTDYSYAQLEGLWLNAGGSKHLAPVMAAIAEAESGGNSDAHNPSGASGLWQILGNPFPGNPYDPATNARMAVAKYKSQGLGAWTTYTSGAYKAYLKNSTTPDSNVPGSPTAQTTAATAGAQSDCAWSIGFNIPLVGGNVCIISKSELRGIAGLGLMLAGGAVAFAGLAVLMVAAGMKALPPLGKAAEGVGGALLLVPGAEGVGAAVATAGRVTRNPAAEGRRRQAAGAKEDAELERRMGRGPSSENRSLRTGRGAIRETPAETRRRKAAGRSRERAASGEEPPF